MNDELTSNIIKTAFNVYNELGTGFLEKVYHNAMIIELQLMGFKVESEYPIPVFYKGNLVGNYNADLFVEDALIVELKAVENTVKAHEVQLVNYLQGTGNEIGLLINFGRSVEIKRKYRTYKSPKV